MPQAPRRWGMGEGLSWVCPSPLGEGYGDGAVPSPRKFLRIYFENTIF